MKDYLLKFRYEFEEESGILYKEYFGSVNLDLIRNSWEIGIKNNLIPEDVKGFIIDYRKATFDIPLNRLNEIPTFYKKYPLFFIGKKLAILTDNPRDIVIPMVCQSLDDGYQSKPFMTIEAARIWILTGFF